MAFEAVILAFSCRLCCGIATGSVFADDPVVVLSQPAELIVLTSFSGALPNATALHVNKHNIQAFYWMPAGRAVAQEERVRLDSSLHGMAVSVDACYFGEAPRGFRRLCL